MLLFQLLAGNFILNKNLIKVLNFILNILTASWSSDQRWLYYGSKVRSSISGGQISVMTGLYEKGDIKMKNHGGYSDRDNSTYRIVNTDPATILQHIKNSNYGDHNLVIYPGLEQFEEFYIECCKDSILDRNGTFVLVTHYQHVSAVRKKMDLLAGIDTARYENDGTLVILDSEMAYQPSVEQNGRYNIITILTSLLMRLAEEGDKKGITVLSDLGTFFLKKRIADLISHELSVLSRIDANNIRSFCCYHKDDFSVLQEEQKNKILRHHSNNLILD